VYSTLTSLASSGTGTTVDGAPTKTVAQAILNSSPWNELGQLQVKAKSFFWYGGRLQIYPGLPDPDIPGTNWWGIIQKYFVDNQADEDGLFLDDMSGNFASVENHRRSLWAYVDNPLSFSYATRRVMQWDGTSLAEFGKAIRAYLNGKGKYYMGSSNPVSTRGSRPTTTSRAANA
jgi:hypothetical protein